MEISMNLLSVSKKHLDCILNFMEKAQNQPENYGNEEVIISEPKEAGNGIEAKFSAEYEVMGGEEVRNYNEQNVGKSKKRIETLKVIENERHSDFTDQMDISRAPILA